MHRWIVRICSFAFAVVLAICSIQAVQGIQNIAPFGSTVAFQLNIVAAVETKGTLAQDLAAIGEDSATTIAKVSPNKEKYKTERDVILFSGDLGSSAGPVVKEDKVFWVNQDITGRVIDYKEMGERTLNGEFFAIDSPGLRESIQAWAEANAISVEWRDALPFTTAPSLMGAMVLSASGLLIPACFLLTLAAASVSLQKRWRQQKVEITGGKPYRRVRVESASENLTHLVQGSVAGIAVSLLYIGSFSEGAEQVKAVVSACAGAVFLFILASAFAVCLLSFFAAPPFRALGVRNNTSKALKTFALILELSGTVVVIVAIAAALSAIAIQNQALRQADTYSKIPDATRLSLLSAPTGNAEAGKDLFSVLLQQAEEDSVLMLSLDVNQSIGLSDDDLSEFDHFLIANKAYLDSMGVGIGSVGPSGLLSETPMAEVPPFVQEQTSLWRAEGNGQPLRFYRYEGPGMVSLGPNTGKGGESVICTNPLVLVVDSTATEWDYDGFVQPLLSSGNIFFSDYTSAKELVDMSGTSDLVASIDNMAELTLQASQDISMRIRVLSLSVVVSLAIVIVMSFQAAASWCVASAKLIFAQRGQGRTLPGIAREKIAGRAAISATASLIGFFVAFFIIKNSLLSSIWVALAVFVLAVAFQIAFRCHLASNIFHKTATRR